MVNVPHGREVQAQEISEGIFLEGIFPLCLHPGLFPALCSAVKEAIFSLVADEERVFLQVFPFLLSYQ